MSKYIGDEIHKIIYEAIKKILPEYQGIFSLEVPGDKRFGDLATNVAFSLAPSLKKSPQEIAQLIVKNCTYQNTLISKIEVAGSGFINFFISQERLYRELAEILKKEEKYGHKTLGRGKKIQVEFVSANPTGPLHVGHGRGAAIGDTLVHVFEALGYKVQKEYYINNMGTQMEILGKSVQAIFEGKEVPKDGYQGEYISEIAAEIKNQSRPVGTKIKNFKTETTKEEFFKNYAIKTILIWIKKDLENFGVQFNNWFEESCLYDNKEIDAVIKKLEKQKQIYEKDGALWVKTTSFGDDKDRVIIRQDKRPTYFASDIAYHENKFNRGFNKVINIWGADHHGYVARVKAAVQTLGYTPDRLKIILYQLVSLKRGTEVVPMSTRAGEFVTLRQVLEEVGRDACRFFFLMRSPDSQLDFDLELAKKHSLDNPVYYIQYAHARICSVFKEAAKNSLKLEDRSLKLKTIEFLKEEEELDLIKKLAQFPQVVEDIAANCQLHHLTVYLQELATIFHNYYTRHRIIGEDTTLTQARLILIKAVQIVLRNCLSLMGISAPEKM